MVRLITALQKGGGGTPPEEPVQPEPPKEPAAVVAKPKPAPEVAEMKVSNPVVEAVETVGEAMKAMRRKSSPAE